MTGSRTGSEPAVVVLTTVPDLQRGEAIARALVEERLAACGHQIAAIRSIYRWEGAVHDEPEARVALHTRRSLVPAITARADELHPYDVPCVIALRPPCACRAAACPGTWRCPSVSTCRQGARRNGG